MHIILKRMDKLRSQTALQETCFVTSLGILLRHGIQIFLKLSLLITMRSIEVLDSVPSKLYMVFLLEVPWTCPLFQTTHGFMVSLMTSSTTFIKCVRRLLWIWNHLQLNTRLMLININYGLSSSSVTLYGHFSLKAGCQLMRITNSKRRRLVLSRFSSVLMTMLIACNFGLTSGPQTCLMFGIFDPVPDSKSNISNPKRPDAASWYFQRQATIFLCRLSFNRFPFLVMFSFY